MFSARCIDLSLLTLPRSVLALVEYASEGEAGYAVARLQRTGRETRVTHEALVMLPHEAGADELATAVASAVQGWGPVERCVLALDETRLAYRTFTLPFGRAEQVATVAAQEFAEVSPLPVGQFAFACYPPLARGERGYLAAVSAAPRALCQGLSRAFQAVGLPLATLAPLAGVMALAAQEQVDPVRPLALLHQRTGRTLMSLSEEGVPLSVMLCPDAETEQPETGQPKTGQPKTGQPGAAELAGRLLFLPSFERAEGVVLCAARSCLHDGTQASSVASPPSAATIAELEAALALPVAGLAHAELAVCLGRHVLTASRPRIPSFLTGDLAPAEGRSAMESRGVLVAAGLCLLLLFGCMDQWLRASRAEQTLRTVQQQLFKGYRELLPDVSPATSSAQMQRLLEARLAEWQASRGGDAAVSGVLPLLEAIHRGLGTPQGLVLEQLSLKQANLTLRFTGLGFPVAEQVRDSLSRLAQLRNVQLRDVTREGQGERVRFAIEAAVRE